jgi:hypothetical protein
MASNEVREAAKRVRTHLSNFGNAKIADRNTLAEFAIAVLDDPTVLLAEPKWERNEVGWRMETIAGTWFIWSEYREVRWAKAGENSVVAESLDEAKAACFADLRARVRELFI